MKPLLLLALLLISAPASSQIQELRSNFRTPPDDCRPWVYWVWMDGNLTREGITADLEAMKKAGIGGAIIMEVNVGIPRGPLEFMGAEWRRLFTHVVREAQRLGLVITLMAGPGWTGSGGPWVKPEESMQHIVASSLELEGPEHYEGQLPQPKRYPAFFGDGHLPEKLERAKNEYYKDVAVLAYPTPSVKDSISDLSEKALYVRAPYSSVPGVRACFVTHAEYPPEPAGAAVRCDQVLDLSRQLASGGHFSWDVPSGKWTVLRFGRTSTGATTRPAPRPGLGLECDKLDTAALNAHFAAFIGTLLQSVGERKSSRGAGWTMIHMDSWEVGAQNWTADFRREFHARRGYDLFPYLPVLRGAVVESHEVSERFLWDLRQTVQELILSNHAEHLKDLGRRNGLTLSIEPYDMTPCADMSLGGIADVPMGEFWLYGFNTFYSVIEATSIGHTNGRPIVAAEAFTSSAAEHWHAYPGSMKALGDWAFAAGINRFVFHRYQHQPWLDLKPGMTMGPYGVHWERTETWWNFASAYHQYLSRCQYLLRQGLPVADVCFLVAEGAPHVFRPPSSATRGNPPVRLEYNFDGCAPEVLLKDMRVKDGRLALPDGMTYRLLVLPEEKAMTVPLLKKVKELVKAGATVLGPPPKKAPGLTGFPECDALIQRLSSELWGNSDGISLTEHPFGKGRVIWIRGQENEEDTSSAEREQYANFHIARSLLARMGVRPDFQSDSALRYTHRRIGETDLYYLSNGEDRALTTRCTFRVSKGEPELWDPLRGSVRKLPEFERKDGRTTMLLKFAPYQSFFVVFSKASKSTTQRGRNFPGLDTLREIAGPWQVHFDPRWGGPRSVEFQDLDDWTERPEEGIRYYSGVASYLTTFAAPEGSLRGEGKLLLDLGEVRNLARVRLNGHDLGVLWCAPWSVEIGRYARPNGNQLEITVANLWINRLIGDERFPPDAEYGKRGNLLRFPEWLSKGEKRPATGRYAFSTWKHFTADSTLVPSGLLGPVRLVRERP